MPSELINRYIWLIDTIRRHGRITQAELSRQWQKSRLSNGQPLPRRSFHHYRIGAEQTFGINIQCDRSTYEYYIAETDLNNLHEWLLDSTAINDTLRDNSDIASRILLEDVPSARVNLQTIISALRQNSRIVFDYRGYTHAKPTPKVAIEPYFVKIFKQLWYVIGFNVKDKKIKTYALDRITNLNIDAGHTFQMPPEFSPKAFFQDCFGITTSNRPPQRIVLRVEPTQAKYFRALPLHHSQIEVVHDNYSIFTYRMCVTYDLRERLLSHGSNIEILEPQSLRTVIAGELEAALRQYRTSAQ